MGFQFKNSLNNGVNLDLDELRLPPDTAVFIKNLTDNVNTNAANAALGGGNQKVRTPIEGNVALSVSGMPSGTNATCGFYSSEQTNEGYFAVYNSNGNHTVWVISGDNGVVRKVHQSTLLPFQSDPSFFYAEGRMTLELKSIIDPVTKDESNFKFLVFTNNTVLQCFIEVEGSIATSSYTTPYFTATAAFYDRLELIHLTRPLPIKCVKLNDPTSYVPQADDANKQNMLINSGWQFRIRTWDVFGRPSEWGIISSVFTSVIGGGCIQTSNGLPRCVNLCFDAGNPMTKFITVAYRRGVGNDPSGQLESGWMEAETFRVYNDSTSVPWYQRPYNPVFVTAGSGITFNAATNIITYAFCADKGSNPIDPTEAARTEPGTPRWSSSVGSVNKKILLANNVYGFEPIDRAVTNAINFTVKTPDPAQGEVPCDAPPEREIVFYANIYRPYTDTSAVIFQSFNFFVFGDEFGGGSTTIPPTSTSSYTSNFKLGQIFGDQTTPGFIAYLEGTPHKVIGEWGNWNPSTKVFTPVNIITEGPGDFPDEKMVRFRFTGIPAGKYVARLSSHHSKLSDPDLHTTSTQVGGVCALSNLSVPNGRFNGYMSNPIKEIVINCSAGNVSLDNGSDPMFVILDCNNGVHSGAIDGYLYESVGGGPIEMNPMWFGNSVLGQPGDAYGTVVTDHNGYFFMTAPDGIMSLLLLGDFCSGPVFQLGLGGEHSIRHGDGTGTRDPDFWGNQGNWHNKFYVTGPGSLNPGITGPYPGRRFIRQVMEVCNQPGVGVPGVPVIMTKCKSTQTDSNGLAILIAHNRYNYLATLASTSPPMIPPLGASLVPDYGSAPGNQDLLIYSQKGGCQWNACNSCDTFLPTDPIVTYMACGDPSVCVPSQPARTLCLQSLSGKPNGVGIAGVQSGGKYPVAYWLHDVIARHNAPQIKEGDLGYVFVPNLNDTTPSPYPAEALCKLQVTIPGGLTVDPVFKKITFLVGSNCLFNDFFSWAADWIQYVDNTGVTNTANPTSIRFYIQSMNEYNKQYNFGTNVAWDFIDRGTDPTIPRDVVQVLRNGDGTWLPSIKAVPVTYDKAGSFFTVDYIPELAGLQNGCLFRVIRPNQNTSGVGAPYYEQCLTLDINNGLLPAGTWVLPYRDSYLLSRNVPVPLLKGQTGPVPPGALVTPLYTSSNQNTTLDTDGYSTNNTNNSNGVVIFQTVDSPTTFPFFFESPSPSDLWGSHLADKGRIGLPNPYEQQFRIGTEIALSMVLADKGIVNGIGTFYSGPEHKPVFDRNTWGDITVVLVETSICLVICDKDHFTIEYNATQLQVTPNGVVGRNQYGPFSSPNRKAGTNYGCDMPSINTIRRFAGIVRWLDVSGYVVLHNFSVADSNTDQAGYLGYILNKIGVMNIKNLSQQANGVTFPLAGIDPKTSEYNLTFRTVPVSGAPSFINTDSQPKLASNETILLDLNKRADDYNRLVLFASYTPEYYGFMPSYFLQRQFITFKNGIPYIHHNNFANNVAPPPYANFYGTQCEVRFTHVINGVDGKLLPDKVKRFLANELYVRQSISGGVGVMPSALFYADVITSEKGQTSRLLVGRWDLKDGYQCAAYVCATNTPADPNIPVQTGAHAILDGDPLQGRWLKVSMVNNPNWTGTYFELSEKVDYINFVEKSAT
jgi:hypothetical protein